MKKGSEQYWGFLSSDESELSNQYLTNGYVIVDVENLGKLDQIRNALANLAAEYLGTTVSDQEEFLNSFHEHITVDGLNESRLYIIRMINNGRWLRESYWSLARSSLEILVGNELAMQMRVNLSIQLPGDDSSLLPIHADVWSGDSPFEVVVWVPFVNCYGTKSMFLLPPDKTEALHEDFPSFYGRSSEDLFQDIASEIEWIELEYGKILIFNQNLPHGNRINQEKETRWSMNCRFKSVYSPYGDKKLGEFFEPVTLRAASRAGMAYRLPSVKG